MTLDQVDRAEATVAQVVAAQSPTRLRVFVGDVARKQWGEPPVSLTQGQVLSLVAQVTNPGTAPELWNVTLEVRPPLGPRPPVSDTSEVPAGATLYFALTHVVADVLGEWKASLVLSSSETVLENWEGVVAQVSPAPPSPWEQALMGLMVFLPLGQAMALMRRTISARRAGGRH